MTEVQFNHLSHEAEKAIIVRATPLLADAWGKFTGSDKISLSMDLAAANGVNGNQMLDARALLAFDDFSFAHDIFGIVNCMDRETGHLMRHFIPRCARHSSEVAA